MSDLKNSTSNKSFKCEPFGEHFLVKRKEKVWKDFSPCVFSARSFEKLEKIRNFKVYEDDIFLTGFPRSGTTLAAEMIWLIANNFDFTKASTVNTDDRVAGLEYDESSQMIRKGKVENIFDTLPRPRTIRTHLPVQFLPDDIWIKNPKVIYCSRDPRDVAVSLYHLGLKVSQRNVPMEEFLDNFLSEHFTHEFAFDTNRNHRLNYWNIPNYPNILYLTYESMTSNIEDAIRRVGDFLGVDISVENCQKLKEYLQFDKMKKNTACNRIDFFEKYSELRQRSIDTDGFIRRGKVGSYKDEMPKNYIERFDKWMAEESQLETGFLRSF